MQKLTIDPLKFQQRPKIKLATHRFQDLMLSAFKEFKVEKPFQGIAWGRLRGIKNPQAKAELIQKAINDTRELNPRDPSRYFVKLLRLLRA